MVLGKAIYHSIIGLVKPTFGIFLLTEKMQRIHLHTLDVRNLVYHGFHNMVVHGLISVHDNLMAIAELHIKNKEERISKINNLIRKFELHNVVKLKSKYLSGGQIRKLTLAIMVKDTKILILDEPFAALDLKVFE